MARRRKEPTAESIKLSQPDRSGPTGETLIDWATKRDLFAQAAEAEAKLKAKAKKSKDKDPAISKVKINHAGGQTTYSTAEDGDDEANDSDDSDDGEGLTPGQERFMDCVLWTMSLTMVHFTLDVFVYNQYGQDLEWRAILSHAPPAFLLIFFLFWVMHETPANPVLIPGLPRTWQHTIRQLVFLGCSMFCGCYMIYITNMHGYLAVMRQAPIIGVLWVWTVIEMDLLYALLSVIVEAAFLYKGGYNIM
ncbi:hypothetical protein BROUX41_003399 [Berkeleyomyces rouxiae]|uniref:uncharacterized protein n=1 Tax=Berkeleyomyces rouxiae TaxID=2035830 RepID=UPI003B79A947